FGPFQQVTSVTISNEADYPDHTIAKVRVQLENSYIILELAYNEDNKVDGINVLATEEMDENNSAATETNEDNGVLASSFLEAVFTGNIEEAASYLSPDLNDSDVDSLKVMAEEAEENYGSYNEIGAARAGNGSAVVNVIFEEGSAMFNVVFDDNMYITDFSIYTQ
ncbi:MAG: DUF3887 domain-containing protein, partial [Bacillota bacterium]|nr:DUF3887 domain-containing protein [Bacillota bacterium]